MSAWVRWLYGRVEWMNKRNVFNLSVDECMDEMVVWTC